MMLLLLLLWVMVSFRDDETPTLLSSFSINLLPRWCSVTIAG
jgi:hypothetical protein